MYNSLDQHINDDELEARIIMAEEWNSFQVPEPIHSRIRELFWEHKEEEDTIKIIKAEFDLKDCYASKCYYFSEPNQYQRERYAKIGIFYQCEFCNESCLPKLS